jgi:perosamine synthetase
MSEAPIPLAAPVIGEREEQLVLDVLRSGKLSLGPMLDRFEREFAGWLGAHHASAVSSGTTGLHLAVRAAGVEPGDEVITSPLSFVASANVMLYEQAKPVFVDIDPVTLNLDAALISDAITESTVGVLPVHLFGYPANMDAIDRIAAHHGLWVVEDACEALGARLPSGDRVGAGRHMAVFGFYPNKQLATGEGGIVTSPSAELKTRLDSERNQGRAPDMGWLDHERLGFNYRLSDVACAIGVAQLERLDEMLAHRGRVAGWYGERLDGVGGLTLPCADAGGNVRGWFVYVVQLPPGVDRDGAIERLAAAGVASKPYMPAIHLQPYYREHFGYGPGDFPIAEDVAARSLALPFFPRMTEQQVERVCSALTGLVE